MKRAIKKGSSLYQYLDSINILETGSSDQIMLAKKSYWRAYKASWRKKNRKKLVGFTPYFNSSEVEILSEAATRHKRSRTKLIKECAFAYLDRRYLIPDVLQIRRIIKLLEMNYNTIQEMLESNLIPIETGKTLLEKLGTLEQMVRVELHNPKTLQQLLVDTIKKDQQQKDEFIKLLETV